MNFKFFYYIFSYPIVVAAWLAVASVANSAPKTIKGDQLYHCVVIDPSREGKNTDEKTFVFDQIKGAGEAQYVGRTATLDFDFKESPISVEAKTDSGKRIEFTDTKETTTRFSGYLADVDIEIHCRKKLLKAKR